MRRRKLGRVGALILAGVTLLPMGGSTAEKDKTAPASPAGALLSAVETLKGKAAALRVEVLPFEKQLRKDVGTKTKGPKDDDITAALDADAKRLLEARSALSAVQADCGVLIGELDDIEHGLALIREAALDAELRLNQSASLRKAFATKIKTSALKAAEASLKKALADPALSAEALSLESLCPRVLLAKAAETEKPKKGTSLKTKKENSQAAPPQGARQAPKAAPVPEASSSRDAVLLASSKPGPIQDSTAAGTANAAGRAQGGPLEELKPAVSPGTGRETTPGADKPEAKAASFALPKGFIHPCWETGRYLDESPSAKFPVPIPRSMLETHVRWHSCDAASGGRRIPANPGRGDEFLQWHHGFLGSYAAWRKSKGLAPIEPWTEIPKELKGLFAFDPVRLSDYPSLDKLGNAIEVDIHGDMHFGMSTIFGEPVLTSLKSPESLYFWKLHGLIDLWMARWLKECASGRCGKSSGK